MFKIGEIKSTRDEVLNVLRAQRLEANPSKESSMTGDIYKIKGKYYLNIRPTCDCVGRKEQECTDCKKQNCIECSNANKVYLIKFEALRQNEENVLFEHKYGVFKERNNEAILGPLIDNKFYRFKFQEITVKLYSEVKDKKKARILQPFIRHITERYALYIQRQALPRIPSLAISDEHSDLTSDECKKEPG